MFNKPGPMTEPSGLTLEMPLGKDLGFKVYWSSTTGKVIQPALSPCYKKKQKNTLCNTSNYFGRMNSEKVEQPWLFEKSEYPCWYMLLRCSVMSDSLLPHGLWPARLLCPQDIPGKSTGMGCHFFLQGIFPTQRSKLWLPHWQVNSEPLPWWLRR